MKTKGNIVAAAVAAAILMAPPAGAAQTGTGERTVDFDGKAAGALSLLKDAPDLKVPEARPAPSECYPEHSPAVVCYTLTLTSRDIAYSLYSAWVETTHMDTALEHTTGYNYECQPWFAYPERADIDFGFDFSLGGRTLMSDETETVKVCYDFDREAPAYEVQSPFEYRVERRARADGKRGYLLNLTPLRRRPTAPSAGALRLDSFSYDDIAGEFRLKLAASFSSLYTGGKAHVGVELVQDKMFDSSLGVKFFELPIEYGKSEYTIAFKADDFVGNKDAADRAKTKKYFAKWGFKIKGAAFTDDYTEKGRTPVVSVLK